MPPSAPEPPPPGRGTALFLDFDGTLAGLQDDPATVTLPGAAHASLVNLMGLLGGALAILSGRDIRDLAARTPAEVWRVGGHGVDICAPGEAPADAPQPPPADLLDAVTRLVEATEGARLEAKGPILAVHYRAVPDAGPRLGAALDTIVSEIAGYRLQAGKMIFEAKPENAHKGAAVAALMADPPFHGRTPVVVGDDATDEDGFRAARSLGGYGVKVGSGETAAAHRLASVEDVWRWLDTMEGA